MKVGLFTRFVCGLWLLLAASTVGADTGMELLQKFTTDLETLQAEFEQVLVDSENNRDYRSSGIFYLARPGRFRWVYTEPDNQYIVADGKRVWLVEKDLEQVSHRSQKTALKSTPAALLTGEGKLEDDFVIRELGERQGMQWLELTPRDEDSQFLNISLALDSTGLARLESYDKFGQFTKFKFSHLVRNPPLDSELFRFVPPPGFDVFTH